MQKDERDLLKVLKIELQFLEDGGYGRSPRTSWRPPYIFEDSLTCMNYDSKENPGPCSDCVLMQLVPPEYRSEKIPCRHIPFNTSGENLDSLYRYGNQQETEETVGAWLRATIQRLEEDERDLMVVLLFDEIEETVGSWLRVIIQRLTNEQTTIRRISC